MTKVLELSFVGMRRAATVVEPTVELTLVAALGASACLDSGAEGLRRVIISSGGIRDALSVCWWVSEMATVSE